MGYIAVYMGYIAKYNMVQLRLTLSQVYFRILMFTGGFNLNNMEQRVLHGYLVTHTCMVILYLLVCTKSTVRTKYGIGVRTGVEVSIHCTRGILANDAKRIVKFRSVAHENSYSTDSYSYILLFLLIFSLVYWEGYTATKR